MEGMILTSVMVAILIWSIVTNSKMKKRIKDLESTLRISEQRTSLSIEDLRKRIDERSISILEESKAHMDAALIVMSRRIGKRENPKEGKG